MPIKWSKVAKNFVKISFRLELILVFREYFTRSRVTKQMSYIFRFNCGFSRLLRKLRRKPKKKNYFYDVPNGTQNAFRKALHLEIGAGRLAEKLLANGKKKNRKKKTQIIVKPIHSARHIKVIVIYMSRYAHESKTNNSTGSTCLPVLNLITKVHNGIYCFYLTDV